MKIAINNLCHENWDAMTPNEKGAFCSACQKTVVDFSKKTTEEIKSFFNTVPQTEKVCGRFKEEQLTELSFDDFFEKFKSWILPRRIAAILFFVFGMSLFSCQTTKPEPLMGKVAYVPDSVEVVEKIAIDNEHMKMGEAAIIETNTVSPNPKKQPEDIKFRTVEEVYPMGDILFVPDTIKKPKSVSLDSIPEDHIEEEIKSGE
jgi:hypothetical protein